MKKLIVVPFLSVFVLCTFLPCVLFLCGCDLAKPQNEDQRRPPIAMDAVPQAPPAPQEPAKEEETITVKAEVGAGVRGSSYATPTGGPMDIITAPIAAGFRTRERISFQRIDAAMNLYKNDPDNSDNRGPKSHEEFMEKIIKANGIILPQLPPNQEYFYDATDEVLKVKKPRGAP